MGAKQNVTTKAIRSMHDYQQLFFPNHPSRRFPIRRDAYTSHCQWRETYAEIIKRGLERWK